MKHRVTYVHRAPNNIEGPNETKVMTSNQQFCTSN